MPGSETARTSTALGLYRSVPGTSRRPVGSLPAQVVPGSQRTTSSRERRFPFASQARCCLQPVSAAPSGTFHPWLVVIALRGWSGGRVAYEIMGDNGRDDLAEFLRARRDSVTPSQVGLPIGRNRRTPGLRREEVAMLAGVSLTWYTWLEQGRRITASDDVLAAIGRALRLDDAGIDHLLTLNRPTADVIDAPVEAPTSLVRLIESLSPSPAYVLGPRWEYLAWNEAEERIFPRLGTFSGMERNMMWVVFTDDEVKRLIVDWDIYAQQMLAEFRAATGPLRNDPDLNALIGALREASPEFADWWPRHDVSGFETRLRRFDHPAAGELTFEFQQLSPAEWPSLKVNILLPVPGDNSAERLAERRYLI